MVQKKPMSNRVKKSLLAPGPFLRFHDKGPGADNINLIIKIFSQSISLSWCFQFPKFHWILISDDSVTVHDKIKNPCQEPGTENIT